MKKIDLMIFDFDGTLVSSGEDLVKSINYMLNSLALKERPAKEILGFVGDGIRALVEKALGKYDIKYHTEAMRIFTEYYGRHLLDNTKLYPNVEDVLKNFKNKTKVILTNKRYRFTAAIAQGVGIEKYFVDIIGSDSTPFMKPDGRVVDYLLNKYKVANESVVIIGDGVNDITVAKNSCIMSCAYLNGLGNRNDLLNLKADYYCENLLEIIALFE